MRGLAENQWPTSLSEDLEGKPVNCLLLSLVANTTSKFIAGPFQSTKALMYDGLGLAKHVERANPLRMMAPS